MKRIPVKAFKSGILHPYWKGENASYISKHSWISRVLGKPSICFNCYSKIKNIYEWANISGKYKRDVSDYIRLCRECHRSFDGVVRGMDNGKSKLKDKDIISIRKSYIPYKYSSFRLAREFGVSQFTIMCIIHNKTWKHIK